MIGIAVAVASLCVPVSSAVASTSSSWAELTKRAGDACAKASQLKNVKIGSAVDFSDKVLVTVDGNWPQPHMKNAAARFVCLYDKRTRTAEANEAAR